MLVSYVTSTCYVTAPSHPPQFYHPNKVSGVQLAKFLNA